MTVFIYLSAAVALVGFFYSARSLRRLVYLLFFYSLIEGAFINYFYPRQIPLIVKDMLVAYTYLLFIAQGHVRGSLRRAGAVLVPIGFYALIYVMHVFNPEMNNVLVGLVGLRVAIFYIPLMLVASVAFETREQLGHFLRFAVALTIPVCLYGIYQDFGGAAHIASLGPGYVRRGVAILYGGGQSMVTFRTLSTFTYSSSFSTFILMMVPFTWIAYRSSFSRRWRYAAIFALILLLISQVSTGGRQALIFTGMVLIMTEIFYYERALVKKLLAPAIIGLGVVTGFFVFGEEKLARYESILDLEQVKWRYETYFVKHNLQAIERAPLGKGSGSASAAARHVGGTRFLSTETFLSKVVYETGIPGFVAFLWAFLAVLLRGWRTVRRVGDRDLALFGRAHISLALLVLGTSFNGWPLDIPPLNALFWVFTGLTLSLPHLESARVEGGDEVRVAAAMAPMRA